MWVNSIFTDHGKSLSQALDDRGDEKVASQLDEVSCGRALAYDKRPLTHGLKQGMEPFDGFPWPGRYNEELGRGGRLGPAEDRGGDISGSGLGVGFLKALGERYAEGTGL
jgi:hypothetical protein